MRTHLSTQVFAAIAIAAAATACGNGRHNSSAGANTSPADQRSASAGTPMTLTGCLQQVGRTYVVTRLNEPSREGIGTSGNGAAVEREQLRMARNAYRLKAKDHGDWDAMIGKEVTVSGSIAEGADLPAPPSGTSSGAAGTSGGDDTSRDQIDKGDLAQLDVTSMTVVSDNCGHGGSSRPGSTPGR